MPASASLSCVELGRVVLSADGTRRPLLRGISFSLGCGEVLAVIGPSGAGKSSLLRLINRLDEPTSGRVLLADEDAGKIPPQVLRRRIGMVMQRAYLFPGSVADNIRFGPAQVGAALPEAELHRFLSEVDLAAYSDRDPLTLSGGEAQRISIARALANKPEILLLDEPTASLDSAAKLWVENLLQEVVRAQRLSCIWVTHDMEQAGRVADRMIRLEGGRITALGPSAELTNA